MLDWNTIKSSQRYQKMSPEEQANTKADYDAQASTASSNTASTQTPTQPATTAPTAPIIAPKAPSVSWDQIVSSKRYQDMKVSEQAKVKADYEAQGGKAEEAGALENVGNAIAGTWDSFQQKTVHNATNVARYLGAEDWANEQEQQFDTAYDKRIHDLQYTTGGKLGLEYGGDVLQSAVDIAGTIAAPGVYSAMVGLRGAGNTYSAIPEAERKAHPTESRLKAGAVGVLEGGANYLLSGTPAANKMVSPVMDNVITRQASSLIDRSIVNPIVNQAVKSTGKNAAIGGVVGSVSGGAQAAATGGDVWEGMKKGGGSGMLYGGAMGVVPHVPGVVREANKAINKPFMPVANTHPNADVINSKQESEYNDIHNPDYTPEEKVKAYDNSPTYRKKAAFDTWREYGQEPTVHMAKGSKEAQDILNVSEKQANAKIENAPKEAESFKSALNAMGNEMSGVSRDNTNLYNQLKEQVKGSDEAKDLKGFFDSHKQISKFVEEGNGNSADVQAIQSIKYFNNLSPETQALITKHWRNPKGFGDGVDPIAFSKRYQDVFNQGVEYTNNLKASGARVESIDENVPDIVKAVLNAKTQGLYGAGMKAYKTANAFIGAAKSRKQAIQNREAAERLSQLERTQQQSPNQASADMESNVSAFGANRRAQEQAFAAKQDQVRRTQAVNDWKTKNDHFDDDLLKTVDSTNIDTKHIKTVENVQKWRDNIVDDSLAKQITPDNFHNSQLKNNIKKLDTQRNKVVDPTLRSKLTLDNINDDLHVNNIKALDRAQNRDLAEQKLAQKAAQAKTTREASDAKEQQALDDFTKGAGKDYPKEQVAQAIKETTRGGKALSADRVINHLQKIGDKVNMPGSREWFINQIHKMKFVDDVHKKGMISDVNSAFANGKPDSAGLKTLSNQIGKYEEGVHKRNNREGYAADAMSDAAKRNDAITKHNETIIKANQAEELTSAMDKAFGTHDIPEYQKSDFIRKHVNKVLKDGSLTEAQKAKAIKEAQDVVNDVIVSHGKSIDAYNEATLKTSQRKEVSDAMKAELDSASIPEYKKSEFINRHMNKVFREGSLDDAGKTTAIKEAVQAAKEFSQKGSTSTGGKPPKPPKEAPKQDREALPPEEAAHLETHIIKTMGKSIKGKSVSEIQHEAEAARNRANTHLANNPEVLKDMITGINALERLSIRIAENPDAHIKDMVKLHDIMEIKVAQNSGVKSLIYNELTGRNFNRDRNSLLGEGETVESRAEEKAKTTKQREGALKTGKPAKSNAERFGVGKMPPKKIKVKPKNPS